MSDSETTTLKMVQNIANTQQKINSSFNARLDALEKRIEQLDESSEK